MESATTKRGAPASSRQELGFEAWKHFVQAHARLIKELDQALQLGEGLSLGDYDVIFQLGTAPEGRLRMCSLAEQVLLSPSGLSRRVERLERTGLVQRERSTDDARSIEAGLTPAGTRLFNRVRKTHRTDITERFIDEFSEDELQTLAALLGRLTDGPSDASC